MIHRRQPVSLSSAGRLACALAAVVASSLPHPAAAAKTTFEAEPQFFIESIAVDGTRDVSPELLISESRLREGQSYSEPELLEAMYRIQRLPFVLDAGFALERGSERGKLRLIMNVAEVRRFFFGGEALLSRFGSALALERTFAADDSTRFAPLVGARFAAGDYGVFFVAVDSRSVQAGYTRYQLFDRQAFLSVGVERSGCCPVEVMPLGLDPTFSSWSSDDESHSASIILGVPLRAKNQSLHLLASYRETDSGRRRSVIGRNFPIEPQDVFHFRGLTDQKLELSWISDSRDDPHLPTRGQSFTASIELRELEAPFAERQTFDLQTQTVVSQPLPAAMDSRMLRASFSAERHWPLSRRQALSVTLRVATGQSEVENLPFEGGLIAAEDFDLVEGTVALRHALAIWQPTAGHPARELWWENIFDVGYESVSPDLRLPDMPLNRWSLSSGLTFRNGWGIFRLGLAYVDVGRVL